MHPALALSLLCLYAYVGLNLLPFLLALAGGFVLIYVFAGSLLNAPPMSTRRKLMMASWSEPSEGTVFGILNLNAEPLAAYMEKLQAQGTKISVTIAVLKAVAIAMREAPGLNSRIAFGQFIPRDTIDVACLVALDDGKDLANAKIGSADNKSLATIANEIKSKAEKLRAHKDADFEKSKPLLAMLPVPIIEIVVSIVGYLSGSLGLNIPSLGVRPFPFGSAMVTSVGMLGLEQAFVPFTPFARVPILFMVGEVTKKAVVGPEDKIIVQKTLTITATMDHRFADGTEAAKLAKSKHSTRIHRADARLLVVVRVCRAAPLILLFSCSSPLPFPFALLSELKLVLENPAMLDEDNATTRK